MIFVKKLTKRMSMIIRFFFSSLIALLMMCCHKDPPEPATGPPDPIDSTDTGTSGPVELTTRVVLDNLTFPWDIFYGPDDRVWMTEKGGTISRVDPATGNVNTLITIDDVSVRGEGGLLGMALSAPDNGVSFLFVAYNYLDGDDYKQKIVRYNYENDALSAPVTIHDDVAGAGIHNGCRLVISTDNKLFATTGDASNTSLPQNFDSKNGKVLRMNFDGSVPADNPDPSSTVWSVGHRNAQGLVFANDTLYSSEHGPDTDDEVNIIHRAGNYGWPNVRGDCEGDEESFCNANNVVEPLVSWTPTIAVSGMEYYNHNAIPQWKRSLLVCTLKDATLYQLQLSAGGDEVTSSDRLFEGEFGRLRDVCAAPDGKVYMCTSNGTADVLVEVSAK